MTAPIHTTLLWPIYIYIYKSYLVEWGRVIETAINGSLLVCMELYTLWLKEECSPWALVENSTLTQQGNNGISLIIHSKQDEHKIHIAAFKSFSPFHPRIAFDGRCVTYVQLFTLRKVINFRNLKTLLITLDVTRREQRWLI